MRSGNAKLLQPGYGDVLVRLRNKESPDLSPRPSSNLTSREALCAADAIDSRSFGGQRFRASENFGFGCERGWFAAEDHPVWFFGERFHERLGVCRDHFQVQ